MLVVWFGFFDIIGVLYLLYVLVINILVCLDLILK